MSDVVIDTSVAVKWFAREGLSGLAAAVLEQGATLHAPEFLAVETANALWKKWRKKEFPEKDVRVSVVNLRSMIDVWHADTGLIDDAIALSLRLCHPVYDCLFLALAKTLQARLITADKRLLSAVPGGPAIALEDWHP
jgi:predicted nucleic acid-binding protein